MVWWLTDTSRPWLLAPGLQNRRKNDTARARELFFQEHHMAQSELSFFKEGNQYHRNGIKNNTVQSPNLAYPNSE